MPTTPPFLPAYSATPGRDYNPAYGGVPAVANPLYTAGQAITGDVSLLPDLQKLGRQTNLGLASQYTGRLPGYANMAATSSGNIQNLLEGQIPEDVLYQIGQGAAERGISRGISGSNLANTDYLRALGLTSLGLQQQGEQEFTGAMGRIRDIPFMDFSKFFVTPQQEEEAATQANIYATAPSPAAADALKKSSLLQGLGAGSGTPGAAGTYSFPGAGTPAWGGSGSAYDPYARDYSSGVF